MKPLRKKPLGRHTITSRYKIGEQVNTVVFEATESAVTLTKDGLLVIDMVDGRDDTGPVDSAAYTHVSHYVRRPVDVDP